MSIRGILLDKDGTLIDCDRTWAPILRRLAEELEPPGGGEAMVEAAGLDPATGRLRAGSVWAAGTTLDLVRLWWPHVPEVEAAALRSRIDGICAAMAPGSSVPLCDLPQFFNALEARGMVAGIATNDSVASLKGFLRVQGLDARVVHVIGYDSVARPKPAPEMVFSFCDAAALVPGEVAVIGDNRHDLEMARAAGAGMAVGVLSGNGSRQDLAPLADLLLDGIGDIPAWLDRAQRKDRAGACSTTP